MASPSVFIRHAPGGASAVLNGLGLLGVTGLLGFAFVWQFAYGDLPCPLCLLQRVAFIMAGIGLLLNLRFGPSPLHYAIVIAASLGGLVAAARQVLLHTQPGDAGYGLPFLGMHFYTWAAVAFFGLLAWCAVMLAVDRRMPSDTRPRALGMAGMVLAGAFFVVVLGNLASTTLECGFGPCPDDPTSYRLLP